MCKVIAKAMISIAWSRTNEAVSLGDNFSSESQVLAYSNIFITVTAVKNNVIFSQRRLNFF